MKSLDSYVLPMVIVQRVARSSAFKGGRQSSDSDTADRVAYMDSADCCLSPAFWLLLLSVSIFMSPAACFIRFLRHSSKA